MDSVVNRRRFFAAILVTGGAALAALAGRPARPARTAYYGGRFETYLTADEHGSMWAVTKLPINAIYGKCPRHAV